MLIDKMFYDFRCFLSKIYDLVIVLYIPWYTLGFTQLLTCKSDCICRGNVLEVNYLTNVDNLRYQPG